MHSGSTPQVVSSFPEPEISFNTYHQGRNTKISSSSGNSGDGSVNKSEMNNKMSLANQSSERFQLTNVHADQSKQVLNQQETTNTCDDANSDTITLKVHADKFSPAPVNSQSLVSTGKQKRSVLDTLYSKRNFVHSMNTTLMCYHI